MNGKGFMWFSIGALVGTVVTITVLKNKYEAILQEELDSIMQVMTRNRTKGTPCEEKKEKVIPIKNRTNESYSAEKDYEGHESKVVQTTDKTFKKIVKEYDRVNPPLSVMAEEQSPTEEDKDIYIISEDEFCMGKEDFDQETMMYYEDGVVLDESEDIVDDLENVIGLEAFSTFQNCPEETVIFVRNEGLSIDYEIIRANQVFVSHIAGLKGSDEVVEE